MRVLIVEDEDAIAEPLAEGLRREGFDVERAATGAEALGRGRAGPRAARPAPAGHRRARRLPRSCASARDVPIIVVTARGEEADRVVGLELGADDYVVKPFGLRELIARIRAVTRRGDAAAGRDGAAARRRRSRSTSARAARASTGASSS